MRLLFIFSLFLWPIPQAQATTMFFVDDATQAKQSDAVVIATVGTAQTRSTETSILTETQIIVDEVLSGYAPHALSIIQTGGTYEGKTLYFPGDARLQEGQKVVLFLTEEGGKWYLTALEQSKYDLEKHPRLGWIMKRKLNEGLVVRDSEGHLVPYKPTQKKPFVFLSDFRKQIATGGE